MIRNTFYKVATIFSAIVFALLGICLQAWAKTLNADSNELTDANEVVQTETNPVSNEVSAKTVDISKNPNLDQLENLIETIFAVIDAVANIPHEIPNVHPLSVPTPHDLGVFNPGIGNHHFNYTSVF